MLPAYDSGEIDCPSPRMDQAAMALALLGPNHRGNVTFESMNEESAEASTAASRMNSTDVRTIAYGGSVKFAEADDVNFSDWYENTASVAQKGRKSSAESIKSGSRSPEMGSSMRYN